MPKNFKRSDQASKRTIVTLELTAEQKDVLFQELGVYWDVVTVDTAIRDNIPEHAWTKNMNLVAVAPISTRQPTKERDSENG